jgi:hypothetical protein
VSEQEDPGVFLGVHRVVVSDPPGVQALVELRLGVRTWVTRAPNGRWAVMWRGLEDVDLDFLRPYVLPPKPRTQP